MEGSPEQKHGKVDVDTVNNNRLSFSSLFSVNSISSDIKFSEAIQLFDLGEYVNFVSVEDNYRKLLQNNSPLPGTLLGSGADQAKVINVPGYGDCAFLALLAPLLGFVPDRKDELGIVKRFRNKLSNLAIDSPVQFERFFGSRKALLDWASEVKISRSWDGDAAYAVFSTVTGIVVHSIQCDYSSVESVVHHLPPGNEENWETSVVVKFVNGNHFQCVVPQSLPTSLTIEKKTLAEPTTFLHILSEEDDDQWTQVKHRRKTRGPNRASQKDRQKVFK